MAARLSALKLSAETVETSMAERLMTHSISNREETLFARGPLRTMFMLSSMPVGGAETLLVNMLRRFDRQRMVPQVCCLKEPGPLGEEIAQEVPVHANLIRHKFDASVIWRLSRLMRHERLDALVTVGAGDKMFWGRLAAWRARLPVVVAALHSTGWPDGVGFLNRCLTPITDAFVGVASGHGRHLVNGERFPPEKVVVIPNGIDEQRFRPVHPDRRLALRAQLGLAPAAPTCVIVAALRTEKNHRRFLRVASLVRQRIPLARFLIVGDGPERPGLELEARRLGLVPSVRFLGNRGDIEQILPACDVFALTSDNEASPVSIMEAMGCGLPTVATDVGSVHEMLGAGGGGCLVPADDEALFAERVGDLMANGQLARQMGQRARERVVARGSLQAMVDGYQSLLEHIYVRKASQPTSRRRQLIGRVFGRRPVHERP